jgi:chromosome segregation ATPase
VALVAAANYERLWKEEKARREDLEKTVGGLRGDLGKSMEEVHQLEERLKKSKEYRDQNIHVERQAQKQVAEENRQLREENRQLREEKAKLRAQFRENWANVDRQVADLRESFAASQKVHAHCEAELRQALSDLLAASLFVSDDLLSRTLKVLGRKV